MNNIKITGEWDGEPIWRPETARERLIDALRGHTSKNQLDELLEWNTENLALLLDYYKTNG